MEITISQIKDLRHGETKAFQYQIDEKEKDGFLIRVGDNFKAFQNKCAHWNTPLDMNDQDFYHPKLNRIMCKTHGATYELESGYCDMGPCIGSKLTEFPVQVKNGEAVISVK